MGTPLISDAELHEASSKFSFRQLAERCEMWFQKYESESMKRQELEGELLEVKEQSAKYRKALESMVIAGNGGPLFESDARIFYRIAKELVGDKIEEWDVV